MSKKEMDAQIEKHSALPVKQLAAKAKHAAAKAQKSVLNAVDRNGDGKINPSDFGLDREHMQEAARKLQAGANYLGETIIEAKAELDRKILRPVFYEDLTPSVASDDMMATVQLPRLVRIVHRGKKGQDKPVLQGSIGYWTTIKGARLLNLYEDSASTLGVQFFPHVEQTFYYMDSYRREVYISLDSYFTYLKKNRVNELELIAQDLGAKSFRVTFKEQKKAMVKRTANTALQAGRKKPNEKDTFSNQQTGSDSFQVEIAAETQFSGHDTPKTPPLVYFKEESDIEKLIRMRMNPNNPIKSKDFCFQCSRSVGMSKETAAKIDLILQQMKCSGTATLYSEVQREERTILEYHIEF